MPGEVGRTPSETKIARPPLVVGPGCPNPPRASANFPRPCGHLPQTAMTLSVAAVLVAQAVAHEICFVRFLPAKALDVVTMFNQ